MATSTDCYPWWHTKFDDVAAFTVSMQGCSVGGDGNVACDPEAMRADAEAQMQGAGYSGSLSLEAYSLARYIQSEVSTNSIEEAVAVAEAAVNRAGLGGSVNNVLLYRDGAGYGHYGPIHGIGTGTSTAPYGRWASTSQDPTLKALLIAQFVASGDSDNFSNGADDQDGPEAWQGKGQASLTGYVQNLAANGKYWVGPLPGIDHWHTFLQTTPGINAGSAEGQALMQAGIDALTLPANRPTWPDDMPLCSKPLLTGGTVGTLKWILLGLGLAGAIWWGVHWWSKRSVGHAVAGLDDVDGEDGGDYNEHEIQQSARWYMKKYGLSKDDARALTTSPHRAKIDRDIEDWRGQYGYPATNSPLVRGYARDKIHDLAAPPLCDDPKFAKKHPRACEDR